MEKQAIGDLSVSTLMNGPRRVVVIDGGPPDGGGWEYIIDEFTRECLAICVDRKLKSTDVIDVLSDLFILRGVPGHVRSDNDPEFIAKAVQNWITATSFYSLEEARVTIERSCRIVSFTGVRL